MHKAWNITGYSVQSSIDLDENSDNDISDVDYDGMCLTVHIFSVICEVNL